MWLCELRHHDEIVDYGGLRLSTVSGEKNDPVGVSVSMTTGMTPPTDMWDVGNPMSFMALVPARWRQGFEDAKFQAGELFELEERELYKKLKREGRAPSAIVNTIRLKLWMEYERCQSGEGRRIEIFKVLGETCRAVNFEKFILSKPERAAWLLCPPTSYKMKVEEALNFGLDKLREILDEDVVETRTLKNGTVRRTVNVKLGELQAKIVNMLDMRIHGAARQTINQNTRSVNLNMETSARHVGSAIEGLSAEELDRQIKALEQRERAALNLPMEIQAPIEGEFSAVVDEGSSDASISET